MDRTKKIFLFSGISGIILIIFVLLYAFAFRAPGYVRSSINDGQDNVDLKPAIKISFDSSLNNKTSSFSIQDTTDSGYTPKYNVTIKGSELGITFDDSAYLTPSSTYIIKVTPYSKLLSFKGAEKRLTFSTRNLNDGESLSLIMEKSLSATDDTFYDGRRSGFGFVTNLPIVTDKFTISDAQEMNDGKINFIVVYTNGGSSSDLFSWLKTQGTNTNEVVINQ